MKDADVAPFYATLRAANPQPATELEFTTVFELLVAVLLSAQATDVGVNKATRRLFPVANTPRAILALGLEGLESHIKTIGLYHSKARHLLETCRILVERHGGEVPRTREELEALPGVGRKTANVVLNVAFGHETMAVDTHIFRVGNRTGLAPGRNPLAVEQQLMRRTPREFLVDAHHWLILHGRYVCVARTPRCWDSSIRVPASTFDLSPNFPRTCRRFWNNGATMCRPGKNFCSMEEMKETHPVIKNAFLEELMCPRRIAFIVNPKAGVNLQKRIRTSVEKNLNHRRFEYGIWHTEGPGHGAELALKALAEKYDIVVAVGGDGTVNEVASALINTPATLGIVPAGSGNGLATHLGYGRNLDQAVRKLNLAETQQIDCGMLNDKPFFNVAGIGFDGLVSNMMRKQGKRGLLPYFLKSVEAGLTYASRACTIELDDRTVTENCFVVAVANGPMYGYNVQIAPDARLDDGLFNVVVLKDAPRWQYFAALPATLNGHLYDESFVEHFQSSALTIRCAGENFIHLDGEGMTITGDLHFKMKPRALSILVPRQEKNKD